MVEFWIGIAGGILVGSTGAGLGLLVTPLLILSGYSPPIAVGTTLAASVVSKLGGTALHQRLGNLPGRKVWALLAGGAGGVAIAYCVLKAAVLPRRFDLEASTSLRRTLAVLLIVASAVLLTLERRRGKQVSKNREQHGLLLPIGLGVGTLQALTSAGSGSLLVPLLASTTDWSVGQMAAVSNLFGCMVGAMSVGMYFHLGNFSTPLFGKVLLGLLPGILAGGLLSRWIPRLWFVRGIAAVTTLVGLRLFFD